MASITSITKATIANDANGTDVISKITIGTEVHDIKDTVGRAFTTAVNDNLATTVTNVSNINTEIGSKGTGIGDTTTIWGAIGNTTDASTGTVYGAINAGDKAISNKIGTTSDTTAGTVYGDMSVAIAAAKAEVQANVNNIASAFLYKGSVKTLADLQKITATNKYYVIASDGTVTSSASKTSATGEAEIRTGDVFNVQNGLNGETDGMNYVWNGSAFDALGLSVGAATTTANGYMTSTQVSTLNDAAQAYKASYASETLTLTAVHTS